MEAKFIDVHAHISDKSLENTLINSSKTVDDANKSVLNKIREDFEMMDYANLFIFFC